MRPVPVLFRDRESDRRKLQAATERFLDSRPWPSSDLTYRQLIAIRDGVVVEMNRLRDEGRVLVRKRAIRHVAESMGLPVNRVANAFSQLEHDPIW